jgi:hypothetical protein
MPARSKSPAPRKKKDELKALFENIDVDGSGGIDCEELKLAMVKQFDISLSTKHVEGMMAEADLDHNGLIDLEEFKVLMVKLRGNKESFENLSIQERAARNQWLQLAGIGAIEDSLNGLADLCEPIQSAVRRSTPVVMVAEEGSKEKTMAIQYAGLGPKIAAAFINVAYVTAMGTILQMITGQANAMAAKYEDDMLTPEAVRWMEYGMYWMPQMLFIHLAMTGHQHIGNFAMGFQLVDSTDHTPIGPARQLWRNAIITTALMLTVIGGFVDFIWFLTSKDGSSLTDWCAGTRIIVQDKPPMKPAMRVLDWLVLAVMMVFQFNNVSKALQMNRDPLAYYEMVLDSFYAACPKSNPNCAIVGDEMMKTWRYIHELVGNPL